MTKKVEKSWENTENFFLKKCVFFRKKIIIIMKT